MTDPRRSAGPTPRMPRRWPALAAAGLLLTSGGIGALATLPAQADTHETPSTAPSATVAAEPGPATPSRSVTPTPSATPTAPGTPAPTGAATGSPGADADKSTGGGLAKTGR